MGVSPWVAGPIAVLGVLALLSVLGLGSAEQYNLGFGNASFADVQMDNSLGVSPIYYDYGGNPKCYANLTCIAENGRLVSQKYIPGLVFWNNGSTINYPLWHDATRQNPVKWTEVSNLDGVSSASGGFTVSLGTTLGLLAVIAGIIAVGVIASVKFFGFGLSDVGINTLMKGAAYIIVFALFSGLAMNLIIAGGDLFTPIIYLALTGVFMFGVMGEIGTPSSG